jgi:putative transposase
VEKDIAGKRKRIIWKKDKERMGYRGERSVGRGIAETVRESALRAKLSKKKVHTVIRKRAGLVESEVEGLSIEEQCKLLSISRASYYYEKRDNKSRRKHAILGWIYEVLTELPFYGYRKVYEALKELLEVTMKQIRRIMRQNGLKGLMKKKKTSIGNKLHKKYAYLLKDYEIRFPNQVWATDITYINVRGSYLYMTAIIDIYSRKVLSWRISNTMEKEFCVSALEEALKKYGTPAIFNSDQGSQYTSEEFIRILEAKKIRISMDGKGRALDNIYIERFWKTLKYEDIKFKYYGEVSELKYGVANFVRFYNENRFHQSLDYKTPDEVYCKPFSQGLKKAA